MLVENGKNTRRKGLLPLLAASLVAAVLIFFVFALSDETPNDPFKGYIPQASFFQGEHPLLPFAGQAKITYLAYEVSSDEYYFYWKNGNMNRSDLCRISRPAIQFEYDSSLAHPVLRFKWLGLPKNSDGVPVMKPENWRNYVLYIVIRGRPEDINVAPATLAKI